jgi:adenosine deaminase CECR1
LIEDPRTALIAKEHSQAFDGHAVTAALAVEKWANELVGEIRKEDEREIYGKLKDKQGRQRVVADHFLGNVDLNNKTKLLKVAKKMPKGPISTAILTPACFQNSFWKMLGAESQCASRVHMLLLVKKQGNAEISFLVPPPQPEGVNLLSEGYVAQSWMKYPKFCKEFPDGVEAVEKWLIWKTLLNEEEVYNTYQTRIE